MASVIDLQAVMVEHGFDANQAQYFIRGLQAAGRLPRGTRGAWRAMPRLTRTHLADFLIALAGPVASALENIERFSVLVCDGRYLRDDLAEFIRQFQESAAVGDGFQLASMQIINDLRCPEVNIRLVKGRRTDELNYIGEDSELQRSGVRNAVIIDGQFFISVAGLLRQPAEVPPHATMGAA